MLSYTSSLHIYASKHSCLITLHYSFVPPDGTANTGRGFVSQPITKQQPTSGGLWCFIKVFVKSYKREKWNKTLSCPLGEPFKELHGKESRVYETTQAIATETKQCATNGVKSVNLYTHTILPL